MPLDNCQITVSSPICDSLAGTITACFLLDSVRLLWTGPRPENENVAQTAMLLFSKLCSFFQLLPFHFYTSKHWAMLVESNSFKHDCDETHVTFGDFL